VAGAGLGDAAGEQAATAMATAARESRTVRFIEILW
jgi:hypothetical protein